MRIICVSVQPPVADEAFAAYNWALGPKKPEVLPGGHFTAYIEDFAQASGVGA